MLEIEKKYKILIVDDSRFNRLVMTSMLANDYIVEEACDGKEAMLILQDRLEEFSLILLDIVMPNMDGFAFLKHMEECGWLEFLPVIMISSEYTPENIERSYRLGASDLIRRPYDERVICHRIANTIALSSKHRKLSNALADEVIKENQSNEAMISILSHIVETRNGESGAHVQNIRYITGLLLKKLIKTTDRYPLTKEEMLRIVTASALHDIGKMSVPEEILNKPGRLTDEEFQIMKGHAITGANMVEPLLHKKDANPLIRMTYEICRWHHERYDGRGYPDGLKRDEIPIAAQVVSVADVYDALTSERCYKPMYPPEEAMRMICAGECGAFNPLLLDCLCGILDKLEDLSPAQESITEADKDSNHLLVVDALAHSQENGLFSSGKITQMLMRERLRAKFFFNDSSPAFYYTVSPPSLHLNKAGRKLFGEEEFIVDSNKELDAYAGYDLHTLERLKDKLAAATNEHPLVKEEILLNLHGETPQQYQCVMQTIWDSADARHYAEVAGRLIPMDEEASKATADEGEAFYAASNTMTGMEAWHLVNTLKFMIYNVRLVDPLSQRIVEFDSSGKLFKSDHYCYELWKQDRKCANCTSIKCLKSQKKFSKIVFFDSEVFYVVSQYIKVDNTPLVLEGLIRITNDAMIDKNGNTLSSSSISDLNNKLYLDPLTNVYNRRYYNAKVNEPKNICALAIVNVDDFKSINDTYGRTTGDNILMHIAKAISEVIRTPDTLVRYDGDEFVIIFESIAADAFHEKLHNICDAVSNLSIEGVEGQHITVSIGGAIGPDVPSALLEKADEMLHKAKKIQGTVII